MFISDILTLDLQVKTSCFRGKFVVFIFTRAFFRLEGKALPENSFILFAYFWLGWVFIAAWAFSGCRLLIVVAFLAVDHGL